jgi:hypothetical protein
MAHQSFVAASTKVKGKEDWLLLWDRIGTSDWEAETRIQSASSILTSFWRDGWYSRVFLQAEHLQWTMMFTSREHTFLNSAATG